MQPEDSQIDVLLKRYGGHAPAGAPADHLDADELNAFAEGAAPATARSRYVSHLAECRDCRTLATQLSITADAALCSLCRGVGCGCRRDVFGSPPSRGLQARCPERADEPDASQCCETRRSWRSRS